MTTLFDRLWIPAQRAAAADAQLPHEDDTLLGVESANPSLQLEGWEPVAGAAGPAHMPGSS